MDTEYRYDIVDCSGTRITCYTKNDNHIRIQLEPANSDTGMIIELTPIMAEDLATALLTAKNHLYRRKLHARESE